MGRLKIAAGLLGLGLLAGPAQAQNSPGLVIHSGETWLFRVEQGQPLAARKAAADAKPASGELLVSMKAEMGTMMTVTNNSGKAYDYRAFMMRQPGAREERTSVCTLVGGGPLSIEHWPYSIAAIRIADFTETDSQHLVCR
jgi:hypothetical protein